MKYTDEELKMFEEIDVLWEQQESSFANVEIQRQEIFAEMENIMSHYSGLKSLERMEEMMGKLRKTHITVERCYSAEDVLSSLSQKIHCNAWNRMKEG